LFPSLVALVTATLGSTARMARANDNGPPAQAERNELRGILSRIDLEARAVRIRSSTSTLSAEAVARHASETERALDASDPRLRQVGARLAREADALEAAVHGGAWVDVPDRSEAVQRTARQLDEQLGAIPASD
jgi:hypothetical protein